MLYQLLHVCGLQYIPRAVFPHLEDPRHRCILVLEMSDIVISIFCICEEYFVSILRDQQSSADIR